MIEKFFACYKENGQFKLTILGIKMKFKAPSFNQLEEACCIQNLKKFKEQNTNFPHPIGIVIHPWVKVGKNCTIFHNVTIGLGKTINGNNIPEIGDNVIIYPNTVICGGVKIGNNSIVGACSKVIEDVPENCVVSGNPAKFIKNRDEKDV